MAVTVTKDQVWLATTPTKHSLSNRELALVMAFFVGEVTSLLVALKLVSASSL
jgi:hypothetical protein